MVADTLKRWLYATGALSLYHRLRNGHSLTVIMYHRVLAASDPRWRTSDPEYTLSDEFFARTLRFLKRHYRIVSLGDVLAARRGERRLPRRALLVTFDDGWSDTADCALPILERERIPAVMFTVADAIGREAAFWQEQIVAAWRAGRLDLAELERVAMPASASNSASDGIDRVRALVAALEALDDPARERLLAPFAPRLAEGTRLMVSGEELRRLLAGGVGIGLHGKTHVPLTRACDLDAELDLARRIVAGHLGEPPENLSTLSFPHGRWTPAIVARAREIGYELLFTSVPSINRVTAGCPDLLARVGITTATAQDAAGRFRPDWLALRLFRRPAVQLS